MSSKGVWDADSFFEVIAAVSPPISSWRPPACFERGIPSDRGQQTLCRRAVPLRRRRPDKACPLSSCGCELLQHPARVPFPTCPSSLKSCTPLSPSAHPHPPRRQDMVTAASRRPLFPRSGLVLCSMPTARASTPCPGHRLRGRRATISPAPPRSPSWVPRGGGWVNAVFANKNRAPPHRRCRARGLRGGEQRSQSRGDVVPCSALASDW